MCGIFGVAFPGNKGFSSEKAMDVLISNMNINMFRGSDSTGMVCVENDGTWSTLKAIGGPGDLTSSKAWSGFRDGITKGGSIVFGHGRAATKGKVTWKNAHPFEVYKNADRGKNAGRIVLVHNGTLHTYQQLPGFHEHDVDSEWMAKKIAELGPKEALGKISGAVATVWYDNETGLVYFYRNDERPLHIVEKDNTFIWNSEFAALMWLKHRYNLNYVDNDVRMLTKEMLYSLNPTTLEFKEEGKLERIYTSYVPAAHYATDDFRGSRFRYYRDDADVAPTDSRSYERDVEAISKGSILKVTWDEHGNRTTVRGTFNGSWTSIERVAPYIFGLVCMEPDPENKDRIVFRYANGATSSVGMPKVVLELPNKFKVAANIDTTSLSKGSKRHWKTNDFKKEVSHTVKFSGPNVYNIQSYWNSEDGHLREGQEVILYFNMEDAEFLGGNAHRCVGFRDSNKVDFYVEFFTISTKETGICNGLYKCKIANLSLSNNDEYRSSRAYVRARVCDLVPCGKHDVAVNGIEFELDEPEIISQVGGEDVMGNY